MCQAFLTSNSQKSYFILNQEANLEGFDRHFKLITYKQADFISFGQTERWTDGRILVILELLSRL